MSTREEFLLGLLDDLHAEYRARSRPIVAELAAIEAMKPPKPFFVFDIPPASMEMAEMIEKCRRWIEINTGIFPTHFPGVPPQWPAEVTINRRPWEVTTWPDPPGTRIDRIDSQRKDTPNG